MIEYIQTNSDSNPNPPLNRGLKVGPLYHA